MGTSDGFLGSFLACRPRPTMTQNIDLANLQAAASGGNTGASSEVEALFNQGLERYKAGEAVEDLIPLFKEVCDRAPKSGAAFTCLAWLYLLAGNGSAAYKVAQRSVKLSSQDPQSRVNLAIAALEAGKKGVRDHIEIASQVMALSSDLRQEVEDNLAEGLRRRPDWPSLLRVRQWLFGA